jgi:hypothetical protein
MSAAFCAPRPEKTVTGFTFHTAKRGFSFTDTLRGDIQKKLEGRLPATKLHWPT